MKIEKDTPTFKKEGRRIVECPYCKKRVASKDTGWILYTRIKDNKRRAYKCCHCHNCFELYPPFKTTGKNERWEIKHGGLKISKEEFEKIKIDEGLQKDIIIPIGKIEQWKNLGGFTTMEEDLTEEDLFDTISA